MQFFTYTYFIETKNRFDSFQIIVELKFHNISTARQTSQGTTITIKNPFISSDQTTSPLLAGGTLRPSSFDVLSDNTRININGFFALVAANQDTKNIIEAQANLVASMGGNPMITKMFYESLQRMLLNATSDLDERQKILLELSINENFAIAKSLATSHVGIENFDKDIDLRANSEYAELYETYDQLFSDTFIERPDEITYLSSGYFRELITKMTVLSLKAGRQCKNGE